MSPFSLAAAKSAPTPTSFPAQRPGPPMPDSLYYPAETGPLARLRGWLPAPVTGLGSQVAASYQKLSTPQKVVGGALLLLLGRHLLRGKK